MMSFECARGFKGVRIYKSQLLVAAGRAPDCVELFGVRLAALAFWDYSVS